MPNPSAGRVLEWINALEGLRKRVGKKEALDWEKERKERENQAMGAVAGKGRSSSNSVSYNNAYSKVRSDGKQKDRYESVIGTRGMNRDQVG